MPYEFGINQCYCVDPAWFYCMATGMGKLDADFFQQEVVNTGITPDETAISHLVNPLLARIGFPADTFTISFLDPSVIEYSGFPLQHGLFYIFFNDDAIRSIVDGYPDRVTCEFTAATKELLKVLQITGGFDPIVIVYVEKVEPAENAE
ncbi:MAG: hypothetical protein HY290_27470 [Planctomycetia bacterium]|nr:hypothetical protein [Planctomycetia bacterium]